LLPLQVDRLLQRDFSAQITFASLVVRGREGLAEHELARRLLRRRVEGLLLVGVTRAVCLLERFGEALLFVGSREREGV